MRTRTTPAGNLARAVARTLARNIAVAAAVLAAWAATVALGPTVATQVGPAAPPVDRVSALVARHDCWSGDAPAAAAAPTRAVVTLPGGRARVVPAATGFGIWLEGRPGVVHAFCP